MCQSPACIYLHPSGRLTSLTVLNIHSVDLSKVWQKLWSLSYLRPLFCTLNANKSYLVYSKLESAL